MGAIAQAMARLDEDDLTAEARQRILTWMVSRWGPFPVAAAAGATPRSSPNGEYALGQELEVELTKPGRKEHQANGYLEDGTLVVVDEADHMLGEAVRVHIRSVLPRGGGTMLFARLVDE